MKPFKIDVAVLLLFFARPEQTSKVFAAIKEARPSKLFLYQDGPRDDKDDMKNILACREVVEDIDWECDVHKMYLERNQGCDPSGYLSRKWMFGVVDKGIILEDDCVPCNSFFLFCKELLDRYENDQRINMICGMNNLETYNCGESDYFFTSSGSVCGVATWKRVVDEWDPEYKFLSNQYVIDTLKDNLGKSYVNKLLGTCKWHKASGKEYFETIGGMNMYLSGRYNIVPAKNMICNIGISANSTHSYSNMSLLPRAIRSLFFMKTYELKFPLKHPDYVVADRRYMDLLQKRMTGNWFVRTFKIRSIETLLNKYIPFFAKL